MKLHCQESSDIELLSACLQDGLTCLKDMTYQKSARRFALVVSRFLWEDPISADGGGRRVRTGVHFDDVLAIQIKDIDQSDRAGLLSLLAIQVEAQETSAGDGHIHIHLLFAGQGSIKLQVECVEAYLSDQGAPWSTPHRPAHDDA